MGWLDRLREGLEEALAAEQAAAQAAALREDAETRPRPPGPAEEAPPPAGEAWPPSEAAPGPTRRPSPADDAWPPPRAAPGSAPLAAAGRAGAASGGGAPEPAGENERRRSLPARLRDPGVLREAFVMKEILDRPIGLRRGRERLRP